MKSIKAAKVAITGKLPVIFLKEKDLFIASTPALDLSSYGSSFEEAMNNFKEAVDIFFEECLKMGTLNEERWPRKFEQRYKW